MFSFEEFAVLAYDNPNNKINVLFTNLKDEPFEWQGIFIIYNILANIY